MRIEGGEMADGWIKLHRKIMESKTFSRLTAIQQLIAIYIILNANYKDGLWYDKYRNIEVPVKRGQLITSRNKIKSEWFKDDSDITDQKIRTTLKKLNSDFLTIEATKSYTLLTVLNYDTYQSLDEDTNQPTNQELTKSQPRANQELTTNNKDKKDKKVKNDKEEICYQEIISYLNSKTSSKYKPSSSKTKTLINSRWGEGFRLDDFKTVIDKKCSSWLNNSDMVKFLRPETLFGPKFEGYLNEKVISKIKSGEQIQVRDPAQVDKYKNFYL